MYLTGVLPKHQDIALGELLYYSLTIRNSSMNIPYQCSHSSPDM